MRVGLVTITARTSQRSAPLPHPARSEGASLRLRRGVCQIVAPTAQNRTATAPLARPAGSLRFGLPEVGFAIVTTR